MEYYTKHTRRFIFKQEIDPKTLVPIRTNEKEFINVLEVKVEQDVENRQQLNCLIESLYPEVRSTLGDNKKIGIRVYTYGTVIKALISSSDTLEIIQRKILPSYVSEVELSGLNKKDKIPDGNMEGNSMR